MAVKNSCIISVERYVYSNPFRSKTVFIRRNLPSTDVRFWRIKTVIALNGLEYTYRSTYRLLWKYAWCICNFVSGQSLNKTQTAAIEKVDPSMPLYKRILILHRRPLAIILPTIFFHVFWWAYMIKFDAFHYFKDRYSMTITMIFGSIIAGEMKKGLFMHYTYM